MVNILALGEFLSLDIGELGLGIPCRTFISEPELNWESGCSGVRSQSDRLQDVSCLFWQVV